MADKRISELTAATAVGSSDFTVLVQGNVTKKVPVSTLLDGGLMNYTNIGENTTPISSDFIVTIKAGQPKKLLLSNLLTVTNQSFYNLIQEVQTASVDDKFVFDTNSGLKKLRIRSFLVGENIDNTGLGVASYDPTDFVTVVSNGLNKKLVISDLVANTPINHQLAQTTNTFVGADNVLFVNSNGIAKVSIQNLLEQAPVNQSLYNTATSFSGSNKLLVIDDTVNPATIKKVTVSNILAEAPINTAGLAVLDAVDTTDKLVVETSLGVKKLTISDLVAKVPSLNNGTFTAALNDLGEFSLPGKLTITGDIYGDQSPFVVRSIGVTKLLSEDVDGNSTYFTTSADSTTPDYSAYITVDTSFKNGGSLKSWKFGEDGSLVLPVNGTIKDSDGNSVLGGGGAGGASYQALLTQVNGDWHQGAPNSFDMDFMTNNDVVVVNYNGAVSDIEIILPSAPVHGKIHTIKYTGLGNETKVCNINAVQNIDNVAQTITISKDNGHATFIWDNDWNTWWIIDSDLSTSAGGNTASVINYGDGDNGAGNITINLTKTHHILCNMLNNPGDNRRFYLPDGTEGQTLYFSCVTGFNANDNVFWIDNYVANDGNGITGGSGVVKFFVDAGSSFQTVVIATFLGGAWRFNGPVSL